ncbi:MAG: hypothetical protein LQ351_004127 [Letrouitia transgressa]|nr:MAG: hypothetical protein LQ351_004127 [Letrouitia transgressa]
MSESPAGPTPGRTPNGTLPPIRRRQQNADPLVRPKDKNRRRQQQQQSNSANDGRPARPNGLPLPQPGQTYTMPQHPSRPPPPPLRKSTPDVKEGVSDPVSGFTDQNVTDFIDIPLVTTKKSLLDGLRHHVARFASKKIVDLNNAEEFTRPVRLHRRDPRAPIPGRDSGPTAEGDENEVVDDKEREMQEALKAERERQREANLAQIAPSSNAVGVKRQRYGKKKTQQIYRNDQTDEQKAASRLRYEEALPWHLEDFDNKHCWVGTYEAALADTYATLVLGEDRKFRMVPVEKWYKFTPKQQFKILTIEEAETRMNKRIVQPRWFMESQNASMAKQSEHARAKAGKGLFLGRFEKDGRANAEAGGVKAEAEDGDDLDFEEDRFADDEENPFFELPEEDAKDTEEKIKRDQLKANFFDNKDEKDADEEEKIKEEEKEAEKKFGKGYKKSLMRHEKNYIYDSDSDNPYEEHSESEDTGTDRRKEEERKKEDERKGTSSDREKAKAARASKPSSGANTPSGRPSKHSTSLKRTASSNNLKRPGSPNMSEASGNESSRKRRKQQHLHPSSSSQPSSLKPISRPMSPDPLPPSSAPELARSTQPRANEGANKRPRAEAGSGSEGSGGEMSDGTRKRIKLKLNMSPSPDRSPQGSRAVSPEVKAERAGSKAGSPPPEPIAPFDITGDEIIAHIPPEGITVTALVKYFKVRIGKEKENMKKFQVLMKDVTKFDSTTKLLNAKLDKDGRQGSKDGL